MGLDRDAFNAAMDDEERERREESATRQLLKREQAKVAELERKVDVLTALDGQAVQPSPWGQPPKEQAARRGVVNLLLSDLHLDEVVDLAQVNGRNAYNRRIAEMRLQATVHRTIRLARDYVTGIHYDGVQVWWGGDSISGTIHDELSRTNEGQGPLDSCEFWADRIAGAFVTLADHFGRVRIVSVPGNHGRSTKKPEAKNAIRSSYDWALTRNVHRELKSDERFSWNVPESLTVREQLLGSTYLFEHGDNFQGGDQIAGPIRPVMMGFYRRLSEGDPFDRVIVGHFHQYAAIPQAIMNGSLVGYSEHSLRKAYRFQQPEQAWWVETPENGACFQQAIRPMDRKAEGW
jgi:hypothetical protein